MAGWCVTRLKSGALAALMAASAAILAIPAVTYAQEGMWSGAPIAFDIPAQPLERALLAYSLAIGLPLLYDAELVRNKRSSAVHGRFPPQQALEILLRETGLRVRYATPSAVTLAATGDRTRELLALDTMRVEAPQLVLRDSRRFHGYGEALQGDIIAALQRHPVAGRGVYEVTLRVWVDGDGTVVRSELSSSTATPDQGRAIVEAAHGAGRGIPPPGDMPQPVSFRIRARPIGG